MFTHLFKVICMWQVAVVLFSSSQDHMQEVHLHFWLKVIVQHPATEQSLMLHPLKWWQNAAEARICYMSMHLQHLFVLSLLDSICWAGSSTHQSNICCDDWVSSRASRTRRPIRRVGYVAAANARGATKFHRSRSAALPTAAADQEQYTDASKSVNCLLQLYRVNCY